VTEPLSSELIRSLREVCILFRTAWKHQRSRDPSVIDDGGRGLPDGIRSVKVVGLCGIESGRCNQRWRVSIFTLSNDMTSKTSAESSHFGPTMIT
jgi:hypothetical protein